MITKELAKEFILGLPIPDGWRKGQFVYNTMYKLFPSIVATVQNIDEVDCYYNSKCIDNFLEACVKRINNA